MVNNYLCLNEVWTQNAYLGKNIQNKNKYINPP